MGAKFIPSETADLIESTGKRFVTDADGEALAAISGKQNIRPASGVRTQAFTLTAADEGEFIPCAGTFTITLPDDDVADPDMPDNFTCVIFSTTGTISLAAESLTSPKGTKLVAGAACTLWKKNDVDADTAAWYATGALST